jgi:hypothetical protein
MHTESYAKQVAQVFLRVVLDNKGHTQKNGAVSKVIHLIPHHSFVYALYMQHSIHVVSGGTNTPGSAPPS